MKFKSLFASVNIFGGSNGKRLAGRAACMRREKCIRKLVEKSERKGPYGRTTSRRIVLLKWDVKKWDVKVGVCCIHLVQVGDQLWSLGTLRSKFVFPYKTEVLFAS